MRLRRLLVPIAVSLVLGLEGCSTIATLVGMAKPEEFDCSTAPYIPRVYSGVFNDWRFLTSGTEGSTLVILDMPFSFVADTLVLPYTIYGQIRYGNLCSNYIDLKGGDSCLLKEHCAGSALAGVVRQPP